MPNIARITRTRTPLQDVIRPATTKRVTRAYKTVGERLNPRTGLMEPIKEVGKRTFVKDVPKEIIARAGQGITTQRAFVGGRTAARIAKQLSKMDQLSKMEMLKNVGRFLLKHKGKVFAVGALKEGVQATVYWGAIDNIISAQSIYSRDIAEAAQYGTISRQEAAVELSDSLTRVRNANRIAKILYYTSPLLIISGAHALLSVGEQTERQIRQRMTMLGI
jgi:hypothetical protein